MGNRTYRAAFFSVRDSCICIKIFDVRTEYIALFDVRMIDFDLVVPMSVCMRLRDDAITIRPDHMIPCIPHAVVTL